MRHFAKWKYVALLIALAVGLLYSAPNLYGEAPAVQISLQSGDALPAGLGAAIDKALSEAEIEAEASDAEGLQWIVRFADAESQLKASDVLKRALGDRYVVALNLTSRSPEWLKELGAKPMALGLDLRGGVHFLLEVDVDEVRRTRIQDYLRGLPATLRDRDVRYTGRRQSGDAVRLEFDTAERLAEAQRVLAKEYPELALSSPPGAPLVLEARLSEQELKRIQDQAIEQNLITLRNRVNQLGVAEPIVQRQGANRIVVQLPGVQDPTRVKELIGATATLEYRALYDGPPDAAQQAARSGIVPPGAELYYTREGSRPYLLKPEVIASGAELVDAQSTVDGQTGRPAVSVKLNSAGAKKMFEFTQKNIGKPMAVLLKERQVVTSYDADGKPVRTYKDVNEIISVATIQSAFGARFQTTGLESKEAHDLAVLLKSGALAAPVDIVEERTVGPSLGADNIRRGFQAAALGLALVAAFMIFYYRVFGLFAIAALSLNLLLIIAGLSLMQATLSMPGIAGIVLTMGIAVDANVLIYERIREELRNGTSPHAAIEAGYDRAFLTIADANITTLIAAVVLFALGAGPVKGFAITLALGIVTSQFTAIVGSRALAHLTFSRRARMRDLPIW